MDHPKTVYLLAVGDEREVGGSNGVGAVTSFDEIVAAPEELTGRASKLLLRRWNIDHASIRRVVGVRLCPRR